MKPNPAHREDGTCEACEVIMINGVRCHETGCPEAWRETPQPCEVCGCDFIRTEHRYEQRCPDCLADQARAEDQPEPDTCDRCGADLAEDAGEGWDGKCGNCADLIETAEAASDPDADPLDHWKGVTDRETARRADTFPNGFDGCGQPADP